VAGIYIHIPYCKQACNYCNFYFSTSLGNKDALVDALVKEISLTKDYLHGEQIETIYFGGGTPSLLRIDEMKRILDALAQQYDLSGLQEFTIETNPDDLTSSKIAELSTLKAMGLNRFSIGIQSFHDEDLQYMNRAHNSSEAQTAVKKVQDAGFDKITIDLIYGTPTMNDERWQQNLETAFALHVPHISSYALTVEPKTALDKKIKRGESKTVSDEQGARQFNILMNEMRKHGYEQYEISNFAKPGRYAVHNTNYWRGKHYLGLGPSAHSFNTHARRWNVANNINYINSIAKGILPYEEEVLTPAQQVNERIMTALRTQWGLSVDSLGLSVASEVKDSLKYIDKAHYTFGNGVLILTQEGKLFADSIAAELFIEEEE
jgi:oxygen-independent coproporphyrinogen-3 oxidase